MPRASARPVLAASAFLLGVAVLSVPRAFVYETTRPARNWPLGEMGEATKASRVREACHALRHAATVRAWAGPSRSPA
jgi:hypothetical protein